MAEYAEVTLNGCCSEGGGARGLARLGHWVVGVDTDKTCRDGFLRAVEGRGEFVHADILDVLADESAMSRFTYADLGVPCQGYSFMSACRPEIAEKYPRLIHLVQPLLDAWGGPFVIENVEGARPWLRDPVTMCMYMFGRPAYRHRLLETGGGLALIPPRPPGDSHPGTRRNKACGWPHPVPVARAGHWEPGRFVSVAGHERKEPVFSVMEIDWMSSRDRVKEAIPPYLGSWIAGQLAAWRAAPAKLAG